MPQPPTTEIISHLQFIDDDNILKSIYYSFGAPRNFQYRLRVDTHITSRIQPNMQYHIYLRKVSSIHISGISILTLCHISCYVSCNTQDYIVSVSFFIENLGCYITKHSTCASFKYQMQSEKRKQFYRFFFLGNLLNLLYRKH